MAIPLRIPLLIPTAKALDTTEAAHPSTAALAQMLQVSRCMRRHGISDFPDPGSRMPSNPPTRGVITIMGGVVLVFPSASAMRSPAFAQAETACNLGIRPPA